MTNETKISNAGLTDFKTETKVTNSGFMWGFWATAGAIICLAAFALVTMLLSGAVSPDEIRSACVTHKQVRSVHSIEWSTAQLGTVGITCNDGYYTTR